MKLLFKVVFASALLIVLTLVAVVITLAYIDPNDYKGTIASKVKEETGRDIKIDGDISLSYYPWLGLDVEGVSISNAKDFGDKAFLKTKTIKARVKLLPLLRKELEMDTLILHGATINLAKNAEGVTNWDDLIKPQDKTEESKNTMPLAALVLGGIDIKDANIYWNDKQQGVTYNITKANVSTGELKFGEPIELASTLNVAASKPALSAAIEFKGTVAYEDSGDVLLLKPMTLEAKVKGKKIPGGETVVKLSSEISVNLDDETAVINALALSAFDTEVKGQVNASNILSGKPEVVADITVVGKDLAQLFKIAEIEPLASQLMKMTDKSFNIATSLSADLNRNDIDVSKLDISLLGNKVNAEIYARNIGSESPAAKGKVKASGADLPALIKIASQFMGENSQDLQSLSKQLSSAPKAFDIQTDFDIDLKSGVVEIPLFSVNALGMDASAKINGKQINSGAPEIAGEIKANGNNLPLLISIVAGLQGQNKKEITSLTKQLSSVPKIFSIETAFATDSKTNTTSIPSLSINALGMTAAGSLKAKNINSESPSISGELKAKGPDLPLLMQVAGSMQSGDSTLSTLATDLGKLARKQFSIDTQFDIDLASGKLDLPSLNLNALGLKLSSNLKGENFQKSNGSMNGKLILNSENPKPLLSALGQADVAQVLKSININTVINGNTNNLSLKPFSLEAIFSGKNIPDSSVKLTVRADSEINLDKEIFNLNDFQITGLGLDVKGSLKASQFKTDPAFSGKIALAPFNLRKLMKTLNKDLPKTADSKVLKHVALATSFTGAKSSFSLKEFKAELDETKLQGDIKVKSISPLDIEFGLGVDKLNADRYLPPQEKAKAATPETVAAAAATKIPVETLRAVKIKGDFAMGNFEISNAKLSDMELRIRADKGKIRLSPVTAKLYQGNYTGDIRLDATSKTPKLVMKTDLSSVDVEPLLIDISGSAAAKGSANISLSLTSKGSTVNRLRNTLAGKGKILFEKGTLYGVDIKSILHQVEIMIETKTPSKPNPGEKTEFDKLTASLNVRSGIIKNKDLLMLGAGFSVTGKGTLLNLRNETWKYTLIAKADETRVVQGEKTFNIGGHDVPINCTGKISEKKCMPDFAKIIATIVKKSVVDKLLKGAGVKDKSSSKKLKKKKSSSKESKKSAQDELLEGVLDKIF